MKRFKTVTGKVLCAVALSAAVMSSAHAGLFDSAATSGWETKEDVRKYKVSTYGYDVRVYEWTPLDNKNVRCVFVAGSENSSGTACYPVEKDKEKDRRRD